MEDQDFELQSAFLQSCSVRPLTPLGRCLVMSPIITLRKTEGGMFEDQDFPFRGYSYRAPLFAHAEVYDFTKYHQLSDLQQLALRRMMQALRKMDCSVEHAQEELSDVIEFVYGHVPISESVEEPTQNFCHNLRR